MSAVVIPFGRMALPSPNPAPRWSPAEFARASSILRAWAAELGLEIDVRIPGEAKS
jgi:hypothetical protein